MRRNTLFAVLMTVLVLSGCYSEVQYDIDWQEESGYRWSSLPVDHNKGSSFQQIPSDYSGITINNFLSEELMNSNRILMNGSGVAAGDVDGDGLPDLYFTRLDGPNVLYKNLGGFKFEDITVESGVGHDGHYSTGAVFADVDGDMDLDLLITTLDSRNVLYVNDGTGNFQLKEDSGLGVSQGSMTMALADVDQNGTLDLYIVNYREINVTDVFDDQELTWENTVRDSVLIPPYDDFYTIIDRGDGYVPERHEVGRVDELFLNNGDGTFSNVTELEERFFDQHGEPMGLFPDWGLAAKFYDINNDGLQDLYVCNDFWTPDRIWINRGDGTFQAADSLAFRNSSFYSMTVDFSDIDRNGFVDIFTVEMLNDQHANRIRKRQPTEPIPLRMGNNQLRPRYNRNSLYLNRGDHTFSEISYYSGLHASEWSWSTRFLDLDLDGYEDLIVNNGFAYDFQDLDSQQQLYNHLVESGGQSRDYIDDFKPLRQQNRIFRNNGDLTFTDVSNHWGFDELDISMGMAVTDLNGDGNPDLVLSRLNDEPAVYKNEFEGDRIVVQLNGLSPNTQAIGAKLELQGGPVPLQSKQIISGGDYLSGSNPIAVFAADPGNVNHTLKIEWPDGTHSLLPGIQANRIYDIDQDAIDRLPETTLVQPSTDPWFEDVSNQLTHSHHESSFNDFQVQALLPNRLSQTGPAVAWVDLTQDGLEELLIGSGRGAGLSVFENLGGGDLRPLTIPPLTDVSPGDQAGIVGWTEEGRSHVVVGFANYEQGTADAASAVHYILERGQVVSVDSIPGILSTSGSISAADYSGDGRIDLFIGGRFVPGQYPVAASSRLFLNTDRGFVPDEINNSLLQELGLVTGSVFTDYNRDGEQDLIVSTEWGPVRLFENQGGQFIERTSDLGLDRYKGWWQGIATGDFTGNGYPDLVITNKGLNSPYQVLSEDTPLRLYYGNIAQNNQMDIIESYYDPATGGYVPRRHYADYEPIHSVLYSIQSHQQFAELTVDEMLQLDFTSMPYLEINMLENIVLLNNEGQGFTVSELPAEAQFSQAYSAIVTDMDYDGSEDIFLSQNHFAVSQPQQNPRLDAGRGLWLKGNGEGQFESIPGQESGINVYGEQRGTAVSDYTGDGRVDLVITQNASETKLFNSQREERGIRIQLSGPDINLTGIGTRIRLIYSNGVIGPVREIQAGTGYLSQNSSVQLLGASTQPESIEIIWADGTEQAVDFEPGIWSYTISYTHP